jgi:hypothetical protein
MTTLFTDAHDFSVNELNVKINSHPDGDPLHGEGSESPYLSDSC